MTFRKVTHVIFDVDGLLMDTEELYGEATQNVTAKFNKQFSWEIKKKILGMNAMDSSRIIIDDLLLPVDVTEFLRLLQEQFDVLLPKSELLPGAERLVKHLAKHKIPIAVATSSREATHNLKSSRHADFFRLFHHIVMGGSDSEVTRCKPSPDIYLICARRFSCGVKPCDCLVFEDAPNGLQGALAAGMQCVLIPDKRMDRELCKGAALVLESLLEFQPEVFGLPAYK